MNLPSFLTKQPIEREIGGESVKFWPVSVRTAFTLRNTVASVSRALAVLFAENSNDVGSQTAKDYSGGKDGSLKDNTTVLAIEPELARQRHEQRQQAISELVDAFTSQESGQVLVRLVVDSCREAWPQFTKKVPQKDELDQIALQLDAVTMMELLKGFVAANGSLFDPLKGKLADVKRAVGERIQQTLSETPKENTGETSEEPSSEQTSSSDTASI